MDRYFSGKVFDRANLLAIYLFFQDVVSFCLSKHLHMEHEITQQESVAREIVLAFIDALNEENFNEARSYVNDDFSFVGVMGSRNGADAYFKDMEKMKLKYDIKKVFIDGEDVCMFYDIDMGAATIFACGWYHLTNGRINTFRVVFDPRPLLKDSGN